MLELLSKTEWWKVPLFWLPAVVYNLYCSLMVTSPILSLSLFIFGIFLWSLIEYVLHRFAFHSEDKWLPKNNVAITVHFLFHGIHHAFP